MSVLVGGNVRDLTAEADARLAAQTRAAQIRTDALLQFRRQWRGVCLLVMLLAFAAIVCAFVFLITPLLYGGFVVGGLAAVMLIVGP